MNIELKKGANMEAKHTKGPWHIKENYDNMINEEKPGRHTIKSANGWNIARIWGNVGDGTSTANARRIVACVNACEGLNPEAVKELLAEIKLFLALPFPRKLNVRKIDDFSWLNHHAAASKALAKAEGLA